MLDKLPPNSKPLEQEVLGLLISSQTPIEVKLWISQKLNAQDFYYGPHKVCFEECVWQLLRDGQVSYGALKERFKEHTSFEQGLVEKWAKEAYLACSNHMDNYHDINVTEHCERLRDYAVARKALAVSIDLGRKLSEEAPVSAAESASEAALKLSDIARQDSLAPDEQPMGQMLQNIIATAKGEVGRKTYATEIMPLDRLLSGGYEPGTLNVVAARRSVGKSAMACHLAVTMARRGTPAVYLSQEMTSLQLRERMLSMMAGVQLRNRYGPVSEEEVGQLNSAASELLALPITVDQERTDIAGIRAKVQEWRIKNKCEVLIIDHLQKIALHKAESTQRALSDITAGLKDIANHHGIVVILMSQIRREGEFSPKIPNLSCLKGSGSIEEDSDTVLLMYPGKLSMQLCAGLEKNRLGMTGNIDLFADFSRMKIGVMTPRLEGQDDGE